MMAPLLQRFQSLGTLAAPIPCTMFSLNMLGSQDPRGEWFVTLWTLIQRIIQVSLGVFLQSLLQIDLNIAMATFELLWGMHNTVFGDLVLIWGMIWTELALELFLIMYWVVMCVPVIVGIKSLGTTLTVVRPIIWMLFSCGQPSFFQFQLQSHRVSSQNCGLSSCAFMS